MDKHAALPADGSQAPTVTKPPQGCWAAAVRSPSPTSAWHEKHGQELSLEAKS